jgi:hypothetical protein
MKNILFWGFVYECEQVVLELKKSKILNVACWVGLHQECEYNLENILRYIDQNPSLSIEAEKIYDQVYTYLATFINMYSRTHKEYLDKNYFDYLDRFNRYFNLLSDIIFTKNIDTVVFSNLPHEGADLILYQIAKAKNIKTLIFNHTGTFPNKIFYMYDMEDFGEFSAMKPREKAVPFKINKGKEHNYFYMSDFSPYNYSLNDLRKEYDLIQVFKNMLRKNYPILMEYFHKPIKYLRTRQFQKSLAKHSISNPDFSQKFVYFPLHYQPELTTTAIGGIYCDQVLAIEKLANFLPDDWLIYIKENPKQSSYQRGPDFFERIKPIKKAKIVPLSTNTYKLIKHCVFVATITGTPGWEAITWGKNTLAFGNAWYRKLPGIFEFSDKLKLENILNYKVDHSDLEQKVGELVAKLPDGVIDSHYAEELENFDANKNAKTIAKLIEELI